MRTIGIPQLGPRGATLLLVALLAMAGLVASPVAAHAQFPPFIPMLDTPSGVIVDKTGNVYVSIREGTRGVIRKYTPDGVGSFFADVGEAVVYGLGVAANGDLYVAMATGPDQGVYRVDRTGNAELLPGSWQIVFPNGSAFDNRGNLYVTESNSGSPPAYGPGGIWRIPRGGEAEVWLRGPLLTGIGVLGPPVGANGIAYYHGDLYVTNSDKGLIVRVPVLTDGSAGVPQVWKQLEEVPESPLKGSLPIFPDGIAFDVHGNVYVTILTRNAVVRVRADDRVQESVAVLGSPGPVPSAPFDTPASLAFGTGAGEQQNLFVTNLGWTSRFPIPTPPSGWPGPALVKVPAGAPGRPLH